MHFELPSTATVILILIILIGLGIAVVTKENAEGVPEAKQSSAFS